MGGGELQQYFREWLTYYGVRIVVSRTPVIVVEHVLHSLKEQLQHSWDPFGDQSWAGSLLDVLEPYKSTERVTTQMEPEEAIAQSNADTVRACL